ncbi:MAG: alkaline phosphatase [Armatimonadota bacterium]
MPRRLLARLLLTAVAVVALAAPSLAADADSAVLFIGDGMGPVQIQMTRAAAGGDRLAMEKLPFSGFATTINVEGKTTDSAAAGTALATGRKTNNGVIGLAPDGERLTTVLERAKAEGKATGIITTDSLWGATPASFAAHARNRGMSAEIAAQMAACGAEVMMGFWKDQMLPTSAGGKRTDGRDLIAEMQQAGYQIVYTKDELKAAQGRKLVGLFEDGATAPSISDMVSAALQRLSENPKGFFLIVEGARCDWFSHDNDPAGAVLATLELDAAVATAAGFARECGRTLVVVTADHETGGPVVADGSKLGGLSGVKLSSEEMAGKLSPARDNVGEVLRLGAGIGDVTAAEADSVRTAESPSSGIAAVISARTGLTWTTGSHTANRVRVFAFGPGAQQFSGDLDNTDIPKRIADSIGVGPLGN